MYGDKMSDKVISPAKAKLIENNSENDNKHVPNGVRDTSSDKSDRSSLSRGSSKEGSPTKSLTDSKRSSVSSESGKNKMAEKEDSLNPFGSDTEDQPDSVSVQRNDSDQQSETVDQ